MRRALAAISIAIAVAIPGGGAGASAGTVHIRGTAYEFNNTDVRLAGATIRVAEHPRLRATTRRDGSYDLAVPNDASVTPYITADGYHTIHLQTFRTNAGDLRRVNFQTPTESVHGALASLLAVPLDPDGELRDCAIATYLLGRLLLKDAPGRIAAFLVGWGILRVVAIVPFRGVLVWLAGIVVGLGVLLVTLWGTRAPRGAPAPPRSSPAPST